MVCGKCICHCITSDRFWSTISLFPSSVVFSWSLMVLQLPCVVARFLVPTFLLWIPKIFWLMLLFLWVLVFLSYLILCVCYMLYVMWSTICWSIQSVAIVFQSSFVFAVFADIWMLVLVVWFFVVSIKYTTIFLKSGSILCFFMVFVIICWNAVVWSFLPVCWYKIRCASVSRCLQHGNLGVGYKFHLCFW